jgi:hypothetical protein
MRPVVRHADPAAIPNLGMIVPTERNAWINLRSMVRLVSMMKSVRQCRWRQSFLELPCGKGFYAKPSTGRLVGRKHLVAVVKAVTQRSPTANLGIDMPKARLHLIRCSDDIGSEAKRRRSDGRFQPSVIDGGKRAIAVPAGDPWQALLELFDLGLLVSRTNYLAFVVAGLAALEHHGWADLQTEQSDSR